MKQTTNILAVTFLTAAVTVGFVWGIQGQLFSLSGAARTMPAYGFRKTKTVTVDPLTYDERGQVVDVLRFATNPPPAEPGASDACSTQEFTYALGNITFTKKGNKEASVRLALQNDLEKVLSACSPALKDQPALVCGVDCPSNNDDVQTTSVSLQLSSSRFLSGDVFEYTFLANGSCTRTLTCN